MNKVGICVVVEKDKCQALTMLQMVAISNITIDVLFSCLVQEYCFYDNLLMLAGDIIGGVLAEGDASIHIIFV